MVVSNTLLSLKWLHNEKETVVQLHIFLPKKLFQRLPKMQYPWDCYKTHKFWFDRSVSALQTLLIIPICSGWKNPALDRVTGLHAYFIRGSWCRLTPDCITIHFFLALTAMRQAVSGACVDSRTLEKVWDCAMAKQLKPDRKCSC